MSEIPGFFSEDGSDVLSPLGAPLASVNGTQRTHLLDLSESSAIPRVIINTTPSPVGASLASTLQTATCAIDGAEARAPGISRPGYLSESHICESPGRRIIQSNLCNSYFLNSADCGYEYQSFPDPVTFSNLNQAYSAPAHLFNFGGYPPHLVAPQSLSNSCRSSANLSRSTSSLAPTESSSSGFSSVFSVSNDEEEEMPVDYSLRERLQEVCQPTLRAATMPTYHYLQNVQPTIDPTSMVLLERAAALASGLSMSYGYFPFTSSIQPDHRSVFVPNCPPAMVLRQSYGGSPFVEDFGNQLRFATQSFVTANQFVSPIRPSSARTSLVFSNTCAGHVTTSSVNQQFTNMAGWDRLSFIGTRASAPTWMPPRATEEPHPSISTNYSSSRISEQSDWLVQNQLNPPHLPGPVPFHDDCVQRLNSSSGIAQKSSHRCRSVGCLTFGIRQSDSSNSDATSRSFLSPLSIVTSNDSGVAAEESVGACSTPSSGLSFPCVLAKPASINSQGRAKGRPLGSSRSLVEETVPLLDFDPQLLTLLNVRSEASHATPVPMRRSSNRIYKRRASVAAAEVFRGDGTVKQLRLLVRNRGKESGSSALLPHEAAEIRIDEHPGSANQVKKVIRVTVVSRPSEDSANIKESSGEAVGATIPKHRRKSSIPRKRVRLPPISLDDAPRKRGRKPSNKKLLVKKRPKHTQAAVLAKLPAVYESKALMETKSGAELSATVAPVLRSAGLRYQSKVFLGVPFQIVPAKDGHKETLLYKVGSSRRYQRKNVNPLATKFPVRLLQKMLRESKQPFASAVEAIQKNGIPAMGKLQVSSSQGPRLSPGPGSGPGSSSRLSTSSVEHGTGMESEAGSSVSGSSLVAGIRSPAACEPVLVDKNGAPMERFTL